MRTKGLLLLLCLIAFSGVCCAADLTTAQIAERALPAVVTVQVADGLGSGCFVDASGTVLTAFHVIKGEKSASVKLPNGGYFPVQGLLGINPNLDIAVMKVDGRQLPYLPVGDSSALKVGDKVVAIGSPTGLENTVSDGIVSCIRRVGDLPDDLKQELIDGGRKEDDTLIQFTAPISPGNSGGPLLNGNGEVVGIVVMARNEANSIFFAVPVNEAKAFLDSKDVVTFDEMSLNKDKNKTTDASAMPDIPGLGEVAHKTADYKIGKKDEPVFRAEPGCLLDPATVKVCEKKSSTDFSKSSARPGSREYRVLPDGSILFSPKDAGTEVSIVFDARQKTVAILPPANTSTSDDICDITSKVLATHLGSLGFNTLSGVEVKAMMAEDLLSTDIMLDGKYLPSRELIQGIARKMNATYVLLSDCGAFSDENTDTVVELDIYMFDGATGKALLNDGRRITDRCSNYRSNRERLAKNLAKDIFKEYFQLK